MEKRDHTALLADLRIEYVQHSPQSAALHRRAQKYLVDGGSHALRLLQPFPPRIVSAQGAWMQDEDGHQILDFWQGHLGNILGHNPKIVTDVLAGAFAAGGGLQTGLVDQLQIEVAEILARQTGADRVRLTTSGSLATMYAIMLAQAYTGRDLVVKVGGGWHGAQPFGLKGVSYRDGYQGVEGEGLPAATHEILVTRYNDPEMLADHFDQYGDRIACLIVEPMLGAGGTIPATKTYLETARRLTRHYGALLILDEVITGFRFRAGDAGALFGIKPDLATFGKIIGGGMPVAAVAGRAEVMELVGRAQGARVRFSGGTYSAHPASLLAAKTLMTYLVENEEVVYARLAQLGDRMRTQMEDAFTQENILARTTGGGEGVLASSSLGMVHFPYREDLVLDKPDVAFDPSLCDVTLGQRVLEIALLLEDVQIIHAHGAASTAHSEEDMERLGEACRSVAKRVKASFR